MPISPQLLRDAASNLHHWRGPRVRARFCLPSRDPELNHHCMDSKQDGPTAATTSSWILSWYSHEQHTCSWLAAHREAPHPPQTIVPSAPCCGRSSSRARTRPRKHICHSKSVFPQDILLYHNNLLTFP